MQWPPSDCPARCVAGQSRPPALAAVAGGGCAHTCDAPGAGSARERGHGARPPFPPPALGAGLNKAPTPVNLVGGRQAPTNQARSPSGHDPESLPKSSPCVPSPGRTSSCVNASFFRLGSSWLNHRSRQLFPFRPLPRLCMAWRWREGTESCVGAHTHTTTGGGPLPPPGPHHTHTQLSGSV